MSRPPRPEGLLGVCFVSEREAPAPSGAARGDAARGEAAPLPATQPRTFPPAPGTAPGGRSILGGSPRGARGGTRSPGEQRVPGPKPAVGASQSRGTGFRGF